MGWVWKGGGGLTLDGLLVVKVVGHATDGAQSGVVALDGLFNDLGAVLEDAALGGERRVGLEDVLECGAVGAADVDDEGALLVVLDLGGREVAEPGEAVDAGGAAVLAGDGVGGAHAGGEDALLLLVGGDDLPHVGLGVAP